MYESILEFGLEATRWLQATYPQLTPFMQAVSDLGRFEVYLIILPFIYWCLNKRLGLHLSYVLVISAFLNGLGKHLLRQPRPYWYAPELARGDTGDFGLPSGHAQIATTVSFFLAAWFREGWLWVAAVVYTLLMGLSRVYLGVHYVHDVVVGILLGFVVLGGYVAWQKYANERFRHRIFGQRLLFAALAPVAVYAVYVLILWLRGAPEPANAVREFALAAESESYEAVLQYFALMFGVGVGFTFEKNRVCFLATGPFWKRIARYLLGMVVILVIWRGGSVLADLVNPSEALWLAYPLRFVRYALLGLWLAYYGPMTFVSLKLADHKIEPELPYSIEGTVLPTRKEK